MPKPQAVGVFPHNPQDVSDQPLWTMGMEVPEAFLNAEVEFGKTVGESFYISDLANMWCDVVLTQKLMEHPEAILPLKAAARRRSIKIQAIPLKNYLHFLNVTDQYLWENDIDTVEDLVTKVMRKTIEIPSELIQNDIDSAFRSVYGTGLVSLTA